MKNVFFYLGATIAGYLLLCSFSLRENPQDPPRGEKAKHHLKLVKVEDGEKTELDTIIEDDHIFVWNGDTITSQKGFKFVMPELNGLDSLHENLSMKFMHKDMDFNPPFMAKPGVPNPPHAPHFFHFNNKKGKNIIDLSDPGIISYKKKSISKGREKIIIIREEKEEDEGEEVNASWITHPNEFLMKAPPKIEKRIKVIKNDNGEIEVFEDEDLQIDTDGEYVKVVEEDGKVIIIKKKKNKDKTEIEVEVEEIETENSQENN